MNIRVTLPVSSRFALEGGLSAGSQSHPAWEGVIAYYSIQVKQTIVRDQGNEFQPFVTYGAVGEFEHKRFRPYDYPTGNGGIAHVPGYVANEFLPPVLAAIGAGFQQQMGSHMALRADVQLTTILWVPLGARVTASLTIPLGHYQRP